MVASSRLQQTRAAKDAKLSQARAAKAAKAAKAKAPKEAWAGGGSEAPPPPPLALHIAAHVRRGDLAGGDPKRLVSNEEVGAALTTPPHHDTLPYLHPPPHYPPHPPHYPPPRVRTTYYHV